MALFPLAGAVLGMCPAGQPLTAHADTLINQDFPESQTMTNPCTGATVNLTGTKHVDAHEVDNTDGSKTMTYTFTHANTHLSGSVIVAGTNDPVGNGYVNNEQTQEITRTFTAGTQVVIKTRSLLVSQGMPYNWLVTFYFALDTTNVLNPINTSFDTQCLGSGTSFSAP